MNRDNEIAPKPGNSDLTIDNTETTNFPDSQLDNEALDFSNYVGKYKSNSNEIELTIFDISKEGIVFLR